MGVSRSEGAASGTRFSGSAAQGRGLGAAGGPFDVRALKLSGVGATLGFPIVEGGRDPKLSDRRSARALASLRAGVQVKPSPGSPRMIPGVFDSPRSRVLPGC